MTKEEFRKLLECGEDTWLDWKEGFPVELLKGNKNAKWEKGKGKLLKDLVAIANRDLERPGFLVYGVKDHQTHREVKGIFQSWDDSVFQTWAENTFDPPIRFSYSELLWEENIKIGIFNVDLSPDYPHVSRKSISGAIYEGQVWFRRGSKNSVALFKDLKDMFKSPEPYKLHKIYGPVFDDIKKHFESIGFEVILPLLSQKDEHIAQGHIIAYYPNTRREIWAGYHNGVYEHILMLKPKSTK